MFVLSIDGDCPHAVFRSILGDRCQHLQNKQVSVAFRKHESDLPFIGIGFYIMTHCLIERTLKAMTR